jgi:hypothetical protein
VNFVYKKTKWLGTPEFAKMEEFADYVLENYIETNLYPIEVWNQYENDGSNKIYNIKLIIYLADINIIYFEYRTF